MAVQPEDIEVGGCYQTADDEQRLVWAVREERVFYFYRHASTPPWLCAPADAAPTLGEFASAVTLCAAAVEMVTAKDDWILDGDW